MAPEEIENVAINIAGIADCACIPVKHSTKGEIPKLLVQMKPETQFNPKVIRATIAQKLEPYKVPEIIVQTDKIARTYKGNIQRKKLIQQYTE